MNEPDADRCAQQDGEGWSHEVLDEGRPGRVPPTARRQRTAVTRPITARGESAPKLRLSVLSPGLSPRSSSRPSSSTSETRFTSFVPARQRMTRQHHVAKLRVSASRDQDCVTVAQRGVHRVPRDAEAACDDVPARATPRTHTRSRERAPRSRNVTSLSSRCTRVHRGPWSPRRSRGCSSRRP